MWSEVELSVTAPQSENIYILRKHPGLLMLTPLEHGIQEDTERDEMDD
jgi:hypothetical protein